MRLEQLEYLIEVARQSSLGIASGNLHLTQQALSLSIKNLENEMGVTLLRRTHQGIYLTKDGEVMLSFAQDMVAKHQRLVERFRVNERSESYNLKGDLLVYANPIFYVSLLPELVKKFCTCYPEVRIMLLEKDPQSIYQILRDETGTASRIGFVTAPSTGEGLVQEFLPNEHYRFAPISRGRYRAIISHGSPLSKHKQICVKTLLKQPIVLLSSNETNNTPLWHWLKQYGEPHIALSTSSLNLWLNAIAENIGVGFLHDTTILVRDFLASTHMDNITDIAIKEHLDVLTGCLLPQEPCDIVMAFEQFLPRFTDPKRIRKRTADGE